MHGQDPDDELEEGEVAEEGELPMPAANPTKRHRLNGPPKVAQQPYRWAIHSTFQTMPGSLHMFIGFVFGPSRSAF